MSTSGSVIEPSLPSSRISPATGGCRSTKRKKKKEKEDKKKLPRYLCLAWIYEEEHTHDAAVREQEINCESPWHKEGSACRLDTLGRHQLCPSLYPPPCTEVLKPTAIVAETCHRWNTTVTLPRQMGGAHLIQLTTENTSPQQIRQPR